MAKDDYHVLAFRILTYLYACVKGIKKFDNEEFLNDIVGKGICKSYLLYVIRTLNDSGYIQDVRYVAAWGGEKIKIIISDYCDMEITPKGIEYLQYDERMDDVKNYLLENSIGFVPGLIKSVL